MAPVHGTATGTDNGTWWAGAFYWLTGGSVHLPAVHRVLSSWMTPSPRRVARSSGGRCGEQTGPGRLSLPSDSGDNSPRLRLPPKLRGGSPDGNNRARNVRLPHVVLACFMTAAAFIQLPWINFATITGPAVANHGVPDPSLGRLSTSFMITYLFVVLLASWKIEAHGFRTESARC